VPKEAGGIRDHLLTGLSQVKQKVVDARKLIYHRAAGKFGTQPEVLGAAADSIRLCWRTEAERAGLPAGPLDGDLPQVMEVRLLGAVAKLAGDPDHSVASLAAPGVRIGVGTSLPRTPAVYDRKVRWALPLEDGFDTPPETWRDNYVSAKERPDVLRRQFGEEVQEGNMVTMRASEARREWGDRLTIASLGALEKAAGTDEFRIIYDATHGVRVNHRIRVRDQTKNPTWPDICGILGECAEDGLTPHFGMVYDVRKAHRIVKVARQDWGYMACRIDEDPAEADHGPPGSRA
jgi:hypothetical protein